MALWPASDSSHCWTASTDGEVAAAIASLNAADWVRVNADRIWVARSVLASWAWSGSTARLRSTERTEHGGPAGGDALAVVLRSADGGLTVTAGIELSAEGVLRVRHVLRNVTGAAIELAGLDVVLPLPDRASQVLDLSGLWSHERRPQRTALNHGTWLRETRHGRPGHDGPFLMMAGRPGFGFRSGEVWAMHVAWSGDSRLLAERQALGAGILGGGEVLAPGEVRIGPGELYTTPWVVAVWSGEGIDGLSARLLGSKPARAPQNHPLLRPLGAGRLWLLSRMLEHLGDPEVEQLEAPRLLVGRIAEEQVVQLDVAVNNPDPVRRPEPGEHLPSPANRLVERERAALAQLLAKRPPDEALHHEVSPPIRRLPHVAHRNDERRSQASKAPGLSPQALHDPGLLGELRMEELDDHALLERDVLGLEDGAHSTAPKLAEDPVWRGQKSTLRQLNLHRSVRRQGNQRRERRAGLGHRGALIYLRRPRARSGQKNEEDRNRTEISADHRRIPCPASERRARARPPAHFFGPIWFAENGYIESGSARPASKVPSHDLPATARAAG